jgi:hypothetical protein
MSRRTHPLVMNLQKGVNRNRFSRGPEVRRLNHPGDYWRLGKDYRAQYCIWIADSFAAAS